MTPKKLKQPHLLIVPEGWFKGLLNIAQTNDMDFIQGYLSTAQHILDTAERVPDLASLTPIQHKPKTKNK